MISGGQKLFENCSKIVQKLFKTDGWSKTVRNIDQNKMDGVDDFDLDSIELPPVNHLFYSLVNNYSKPPYYCSCIDKLFLKRQAFRRHMQSHHRIMIPYKPMKRKVVDFQPDDGVIVLKEFKRYSY